MTNGVFVTALALGAALLTLWVHVRFPALAPERLGRAILHTAAALLALQLLPLALGAGIDGYLGLFGLALPLLVYALLTALWMIQLAQGALGLQR